MLRPRHSPGLLPVHSLRHSISLSRASTASLPAVLETSRRNRSLHCLGKREGPKAQAVGWLVGCREGRPTLFHPSRNAASLFLPLSATLSARRCSSTEPAGLPRIKSRADAGRKAEALVRIQSGCRAMRGPQKDNASTAVRPNPVTTM